MARAFNDSFHGASRNPRSIDDERRAHPSRNARATPPRMMARVDHANVLRPDAGAATNWRRAHDTSQASADAPSIRDTRTREGPIPFPRERDDAGGRPPRRAA